MNQLRWPRTAFALACAVAAIVAVLHGNLVFAAYALLLGAIVLP